MEKQQPSQKEVQEVKEQSQEPAEESFLNNPLFQVFSTERMLKYSILVTRLGFIIILMMAMMMNGKHLGHFVVMFFLTFGLNCSLLYYQGLFMKGKESQQTTSEQKEVEKADSGKQLENEKLKQN